MNKIIMPLLGLLFLWSIPLRAQEDHHHHHPHHIWQYEPISVMGTHLHPKGGVMFSYRFMPMWMKGNINNRSSSSNEEIFQNFMVAPQTMQMNMHMLGVMAAPSDRLTIMVMGNYLSNSMDLRTKTGVDFTTRSGGIGDLSVSALIKLLSRDLLSLHANAGLSVPTGDIDQRDDTPMMADAPLAYPMQLGSGTWDPFLGFTYLVQIGKWSWGAQPVYKFRIGKNKEDYAFGNQFSAVAWGAYQVSDIFSISGSLRLYDIRKIEGADPDLNPMMMPLFNTANSGRNQTDLGLGLSFYIPSGPLKDLRLATEVSIPVAQKAEGTQMESKLMAIFGVQYTLGH